MLTIINDFEEDENIENEEQLITCKLKSKEDITNVKIGKSLTAKQIYELNKVLKKNKEIFTEIPGEVNKGKHKIHLVSEEPIRSSAYKVPYSIKEKLKLEIKEMLDLGIIRRSESPYASPIVTVKKKDGNIRVCADYRKLNRITVFDPEPMTSAEDLFARMGNCRYFSKVDLSKGYWQIPMEEEDISKTAFITEKGHYEFRRMPFGLVNSSATLVRILREVLDGMDCTESYMDDIVIFTQNWDEHLEEIGELCDRLARAGFTVKPSKCEFGTKNMEFLGHTIEEGGKVSLQEDNKKKIEEAKRPNTKKEVRAFLGLTGYYREFIPKYAEIAKVLTDLTMKRMPNKIIWNEECESAFQELKKALISNPILRLPQIKEKFILRTDASDIGLGFALMQEFEDGIFPIAYGSKKLSPCEMKYSTMEKEGLAIIRGIKKYEKFLYGNEFILETDHRSLTYLDKAKFENARVMRWSLCLKKYKFSLRSISGKDNLEADYLSRWGI